MVKRISKPIKIVAAFLAVAILTGVILSSLKNKSANSAINDRPIAGNNMPEKTTGFVKLEKIVTSTSRENVWKVTLKVSGKVLPPTYKDVLHVIETSEQMATDTITGGSAGGKFNDVRKVAKKAIYVTHNRKKNDKSNLWQGGSTGDLLFPWEMDPEDPTKQLLDENGNPIQRVLYRNIRAQIYRSGLAFFGRDSFALQDPILDKTLAASPMLKSNPAFAASSKRYTGFNNLMGDGGLKSVIGGKVNNNKPTPKSAKTKKISQLGTSYGSTIAALHDVLDNVEMNYDTTFKHAQNNIALHATPGTGVDQNKSSVRWMFKQYFTVFGNTNNYSNAYTRAPWDSQTTALLPRTEINTTAQTAETANAPVAGQNGNNINPWVLTTADSGQPASQMGTTNASYTGPSINRTIGRTKIYTTHVANMPWTGGTLQWSTPTQSKTTDKYYPTMPFFRPALDTIGTVMAGAGTYTDSHGTAQPRPVYDQNLREDIDEITNNPDMIYDFTYGGVRKKYVIFVTAGEPYDNPPTAFDQAGDVNPTAPGLAPRTPAGGATGQYASTVWYNDRTGDVDVQTRTVDRTYQQNGSQTWNLSTQNAGNTGPPNHTPLYDHAISGPNTGGAHLWSWANPTTSNSSGMQRYGASVAGAPTSAMGNVPSGALNIRSGYTDDTILSNVQKDLGKQLPFFYIYKQATLWNNINNGEFGAPGTAGLVSPGDALNGGLYTTDLINPVYKSGTPAQAGTNGSYLSYTTAPNMGVINWTREPLYKYELHDIAKHGYKDAASNGGAAGSGGLAAAGGAGNMGNHSNDATADADANPNLAPGGAKEGRAKQINDTIAKVKASLDADKAAKNIDDYEIFVIRVDKNYKAAGVFQGLSDNVPTTAFKPRNLQRTFFTKDPNVVGTNSTTWTEAGDNTTVQHSAIPTNLAEYKAKLHNWDGVNFENNVDSFASLNKAYAEIMDHIINNDLELITVVDQLAPEFEVYEWEGEPFANAKYYDNEIAPDAGNGTDKYSNGRQWKFDVNKNRFQWYLQDIQPIDDPETPDEFSYFLKLRDGFSLTGNVYETSSMTYITYTNIKGQKATKYFKDEHVEILDGADDPEKKEAKQKEKEFEEAIEYNKVDYAPTKASEGFKPPKIGSKSTPKPKTKEQQQKEDKENKKLTDEQNKKDQDEKDRKNQEKSGATPTPSPTPTPEATPKPPSRFPKTNAEQREEDEQERKARQQTAPSQSPAN